MGFTTKVQAGEFLELHLCCDCDAPVLTYAGPFLKGGLYPFHPIFTCDCGSDTIEPQFWMKLDTFILGPSIIA